MRERATTGRCTGANEASSRLPAGGRAAGRSFGYGDPAAGVGHAYVMNRMGYHEFGDDPRSRAPRRPGSKFLDALDRIVNPPPPEPPEEPAPKPRLYVLALGELEKRIVPNAFQIPEAIKSIAPDAEWVPVYRLSDLPRDGYAVRVVDYVTAGFGRGPREIKWYRRKGRQLAFAPTQKQVERFRGVSEPLIAAMGEALDDATQYGNTRRGYAACALTDVLHAQFELALARFKAGELEYANEVEDVLRKVPEQPDL